MDNNTAKAKLTEFGIGQQVRISGKFDFPNKPTYRSGVISVIGDTSATVTDGEVSYSKIDKIEPLLEGIEPLLEGDGPLYVVVN